MKSNYLSFLLLGLAIILTTSCAQEAQQDMKAVESPCDDCVFGKPGMIKPEKTDMSFKVDVSENEYFQPFQYDLKHSYGILGRLDAIANDTIKTASFSILEVGECDRYKITNVQWEKMLAQDSVDYQHMIIFGIEKIQPSSKERIITTNPDVTFKKGDIVRVMIKSETDPRITNPPTGQGGQFAYIFPPFDCPIKLIDTSE